MAKLKLWKSFNEICYCDNCWRSMVHMNTGEYQKIIWMYRPLQPKRIKYKLVPSMMGQKVGVRDDEVTAIARTKTVTKRDFEIKK